MAKYDTWSLERIESTLAEAQLDYELARVAAKARILDLTAARDRKLAEHDGTADRLLAQALSPRGIASAEEFGRVGG